MPGRVAPGAGRLQAGGPEAPFRLGVEARRQRALRHRRQVVPEVVGADRPDDRRVELQVADREAEDELLAVHVADEVSDAGALPGVPEVALLLARAATGSAAADDDPDASLC